MSNYYAVDRSSEYIAHYGIKGMKWGVRKAIDAKNTKALLSHYRKATKKLNDLQERANLVEQRINRRNNMKLAGIGATGLGGSYLAGKVLKDNTTAIATGIGSGLLAGKGIVGAVANHVALGKKGHSKAIKKVNEWQDAMYESFKDTKYKTAKPKTYKDEYSIVTYSSTDANGNPKKLMTIPGSHLTRHYKGSDKKKFETLLAASNLNSVRSPKLFHNPSMSGWETNYEEYSGRKKKRTRS